MPPHSSSGVSGEPSRTCGVCRKDKPVSGVWYLMPPARGPPAESFICEGCFRPQVLSPAA